MNRFDAWLVCRGDAACRDALAEELAEPWAGAGLALCLAVVKVAIALCAVLAGELVYVLAALLT